MNTQNSLQARLAVFATQTLPDNPSATEVLHITFLKAVMAVYEATSKANTPSVGFTIDETYCDWGNVKTDAVSSIIDSTAHALSGSYLSEVYWQISCTLCQAVTEWFAPHDLEQVV